MYLPLAWSTMTNTHMSHRITDNAHAMGLVNYDQNIPPDSSLLPFPPVLLWSPSRQDGVGSFPHPPTPFHKTLFTFKVPTLIGPMYCVCVLVHMFCYYTTLRLLPALLIYLYVYFSTMNNKCSKLFDITSHPFLMLKQLIAKVKTKQWQTYQLGLINNQKCILTYIILDKHRETVIQESSCPYF